MRLIDADKLDSQLLTNGILGGLSGALNGYRLRRKFTIGEFRSILSKAPTIETEVKINAIWHKEVCEGDYGRCSNCDCRIHWIPKNYQYCPHCGAKMSVENEQI